MIVEVLFKDYAKPYNYQTRDHSIKKGDMVIVDTARDGYTCVRVTNTLEGNGDNLKRIVCKVDDADYRHDMMIN